MKRLSKEAVITYTTQPTEDRLGPRFPAELIKMVKYTFHWVGSEMGSWTGGIERSYQEYQYNYKHQP